MKKNWKKIIFGMVALFVMIQFIPVQRDNPPVTADLDTSDYIKKTLTTSCYDCHSNQTHWPLYSYLAPVSWLVIHDVHEARKHMNFSDWGNYTAQEQAFFKEKAWQVVRSDEMPPLLYRLMNPDARIYYGDEENIIEWSEYGYTDKSSGTGD